MLDFRIDDLSTPEVCALIEEHVSGMRSQSPPESTHVLPADGFADPAVTLWTAWRSAQLVGCGALKHLDADNAEVKSMRVPERFTRQGIGRSIVEHLVSQARARGYKRVWLETGSSSHFVAARGMYEGAGFEYCEPFADYVEDPESVFMTLPL